MRAIWVFPGVGTRAADEIFGHDRDLTELHNPLVQGSHAVSSLTRHELAAFVKLGSVQCGLNFFVGKFAGERAALEGEILHEVLQIGHRLLLLITAYHTRLHV